MPISITKRRIHIASPPLFIRFIMPIVLKITNTVMGGLMIFRLIVFLMGAAMLSACAEPARPDKMIPNATADAATSALAGKVCVASVSGGEETNPLWTSEVDNAAFRTAIDGALMRNGLLATTAAACRLGVEANLLGLAQPVAGFDMEVTANVNYRVVEQTSSEAYFLATVVTPFTADFSSAFAGVERLRLANEGAVRTNISRFIQQLVDHAKATPPPS